MQVKKVTTSTGEKLVVRDGRPIAVSITNWLIPKNLSPEDYTLLKSMGYINPGYRAFTNQAYLNQLYQKVKG